ncbi:uncharacterized protein FOMMEDRAFT_18615 [Fomitiporia mediterranea MF3/22]|uniref:uncharacterized protein n=1 Tax=Fomitiporia mediterranea (strain MF3/22) TaxID=694068 RepID=UPI0004409244|nr:uncharacterized protein FOMMEDRAFT_18615 [Fomitiporia mediterranea MF3/22]EJD04895.1 hypothetical protein FOMMEDRAFT_18615 [Fomitiporia mediterranea MF3/22]
MIYACLALAHSLDPFIFIEEVILQGVQIAQAFIIYCSRQESWRRGSRASLGITLQLDFELSIGSKLTCPQKPASHGTPSSSFCPRGLVEPLHQLSPLLSINFSFENRRSFMPIAATQCALLTLPNEIILEILSYCSVETILSVESTCKTLHRVCQSRPVWQMLMRKLDIEQAPDISPFQTIDSIPDLDLRRKVVDAVHKYRTWNTPGQVPPLRSVELPLPHIQDERIIKARLLPGGNELLIANYGDIELWSIESRERLWNIPAPEEHIVSTGFDYELLNDGLILVVATVCDDVVFPSTSLLRLYTFDFAQRSGELVFERRMPLVSPSRIMLQGDFFISCIPRSFQTVIVNWRTSEALILDFVDQTGLRIDARAKVLAGNNLIAFVQQAESGFCAVKLPLSMLRDFWSDAVDHHAWQHIPFRPSDPGYSILPLPYNREHEDPENGSAGFGPWILAHHVFTPTWRQDAPTEMFVVAYMCGPGGQTPMRLVSFRLQLSPSNDSTSEGEGGSLSLVKSSCAPIARLPRNPRNVSNAGLMFGLRRQLQCFSLFNEREQPINSAWLDPEIAPYSDEIEPNISSVDPWSGAIAVRMPGMMKILYFD